MKLLCSQLPENFCQNIHSWQPNRPELHNCHSIPLCTILPNVSLFPSSHPATQTTLLFLGREVSNGLYLYRAAPRWGCAQLCEWRVTWHLVKRPESTSNKSWINESWETDTLSVAYI